MTMMIDIDQSVWNELNRAAEAAGVPLSDYVESRLRQPAAGVEFGATLPTGAERAAAFERWARSHPRGIVLPDEAMDRSRFYGERG